MGDIFRKILCVIITYVLITIVLALLLIVVIGVSNDCGEYEYIDLLGNSGKSNECYHYKGGLFCDLEGNGSIQVSQYKWVQKECKATTNIYFKEN